MAQDKIKIIFMGCPEFAADIFENLYNDERIEIVAIYTRPPAVNRRGNEEHHHPVGDVALNKYNFPEKHLHVPFSLKDDTEYDIFKSYECDFVCVAAYGLILPKRILDLHPGQFLNVHTSLLPKWRGAAPMMRAILNGDKEVGYSIMRIDEGMDTGDYCVQKKFNVDDNTADELLTTMAPFAASDLIDTMISLQNSNVSWIKQNEEDATYAAKVEKREFWIGYHDNADMARRRVLASCETAPSKCIIANKSVSLVKVALSDKNFADGSLVLNEKSLYMGFGEKDSSLKIISIKPDGKKLMTGSQFASGIQNIKNESSTWRCFE